MSLEIYELYPEKFPSPPGLAWQAALKKAGCFNWCQYIYMKDYDRNKESSYIKY